MNCFAVLDSRSDSENCGVLKSVGGTRSKSKIASKTDGQSDGSWFPEHFGRIFVIF